MGRCFERRKPRPEHDPCPRRTNDLSASLARDPDARDSLPPYSLTAEAEQQQRAHCTDAQTEGQSLPLRHMAGPNTELGPLVPNSGP